ncbi:MAG: T9SS type A sorting domain-containing protein [bacterium]
MKGKLVHSRTGLPVASITVRVSNTPLLSVTDLNGEYVFPFLLADTSYTLEILKFGFRPVERVVFIQPNMELVENITLPREIVDDMEYDLGWTIGAPGDNSINGIWQRDIPSAVWAGSPPIAVQPDSDHTSNGVRAFVTGASSIIADNPEGKTTLSSPIFDLTDHVDPILEYYRWFFTKSIAGDDFLQVDISNDSGRTWVNLEKVAATENSWTARQFRISDYLPATTTMLVRFITADSGDASVVDALVDDFSVYDISTSVENIPTYIPRHYILYQSYPNPFNPSTTISYDLPVASKVKLTVFNILGQEIATLVDDYQEAGGYKITYDFSGLASGIYLYRLEADNFIATQKMLLMR